MLLLILFSFLAGLATILAPCVWPILPIVFSSGLSGGGGKRPLGISLGVVVSFSLLTLFISYLVMIFHFDPNVLRIIAVFVIIFLGLTLLLPSLGGWFEILVSKLFGKLGNRRIEGQGFWPGFVTGITLGVIWTPCAGPILATIATLSATNQVSFGVAAITFSYALGIGVPLFLIAYGSQKLIEKSKNLNRFTPTIQKIFGLVMIATAIAIFFNYDKVLQVKLIDKFPSLSQSVTGLEENSAVTGQLNKLRGSITTQLNSDYPAPELTGITNWLNTDKPLTIKGLKGKVVLVDFWTYTCINCIRTLPHVTAWYDKYKDDGFVVIGVHTPEFEFEKETKNVEDAIKTYNIHYPVAQDNNYATWRAYSNQYWPAEYLIDANGIVRRTHFGEGDYDVTEKAIQELLKEAGDINTNTSLLNVSDQTPVSSISPETYLGSTRSEFNPNLNLEGDWKTTAEYIEAGTNSVINYKVTASKAFIILRPPDAGKGLVKVFIDGKETTELTVDGDKLYQIMNSGGAAETHQLRLEFETPGTKAYTFTFG